MPLDQFSTDRLFAYDWAPVVQDSDACQSLEATLRSILTDRVLEHLPPSFRLDMRKGAVRDWIEARAKESRVLLVEHKETGGLVGLLILALHQETETFRSVHIGYLIAEEFWGKGIASELVSGLVTALDSDRATQLLGGVGTGNPASARVLTKAGFVKAPELSTQTTDIYLRNAGNPTPVDSNPPSAATT